MTLNTWKCPDCEDIAYHKGLCRSCTEYSEDGTIITPIRRQRVNADGSRYRKLVRAELPIVSERDGFRKPKKPTKKQLKVMQANIEKYRPHNEDEVILLGESEDEEE